MSFLKRKRGIYLLTVITGVSPIIKVVVDLCKNIDTDVVFIRFAIRFALVT